MASNASNRRGALAAAGVRPAAAVAGRSARRQGLVLPLLSMPILVLLGLPLLALVVRLDVSDLYQNLTAPTVARALSLSLVTATMTALCALLLGTPLAYLLARRTFRGRRIVDAIVDLPMVLPPAVAGIALLLVFGRRGWLGAPLDGVGISVVFTPVAVVLAQFFVAAPFYIRSAAAGFAEIDSELEQAAALDGASDFAVFRHVTAALAWPAILGGIVMTWARALGEFGATIIFAGNFPGRTQTMPLAIYLGFERNLELAVTLAFLLLATSFTVLLIVHWSLGRRL